MACQDLRNKNDLFLCRDKKNRMLFILALKVLSIENIIEIAKTLLNYGASISFDHTVKTDHGIVLVDNSDTLCAWAPTFSVEYPLVCIHRNKVLNIDDFMKKDMRMGGMNGTLMDVVYHRKKSWSEVIPFPRQLWLARRFEQDGNQVAMWKERDIPEDLMAKAGKVFPVVEQTTSAKVNGFDTQSHSVKPKSPAPSTKLSSTDTNQPPSQKTTNLKTLSPATQHGLKQNQVVETNQTAPTTDDISGELSPDEDISFEFDQEFLDQLDREINAKKAPDRQNTSQPDPLPLAVINRRLDFIEETLSIDSSQQQGGISRSCCDPEEHENIKRRINYIENFLNIKHRGGSLHTEESATTNTDGGEINEKVSNLLQGVNRMEAKETSISTTQLPVIVLDRVDSSTQSKDIATKRKPDSEKSNSRKESSTVTDVLNKPSCSTDPPPTRDESSSDEEIIPARVKLAKRFRPKVANSDDDSDEEFVPRLSSTKVLQKQKYNPKNIKPTRAPYTRDEKEAILRYIIKHNEYSRVKGRELWDIMSRRQVCNRTWQSMKEHYIKKVVYELDTFSFLTDKEKKLLRSYTIL